jgi:hypothetical protein
MAFTPDTIHIKLSPNVQTAVPRLRLIPEFSHSNDRIGAHTNHTFARPLKMVEHLDRQEDNDRDQGQNR